MMPLCLSSDELRAAAHLADRPPASAFAEWAESERPVADAVGVRSLLARGLAEVGDTGPGVRLTPAAAAALRPLLTPDRLTELVVDERPAGRRRQLAFETATGSVLLAEREPAVWQASAEAGGATMAAALALVDSCTGAPTPALEFTVDGDLLAGADRRLGHGSADLATFLRGRGLDGVAAAGLGAVLTQLRRLVTVRAVRFVDTGERSGGAVTWLDGGPAGAWTLDLLDPHRDRDVADTYRLAATDRATLRAAVTEILEDTGGPG